MERESLWRTHRIATIAPLAGGLFPSAFGELAEWTKARPC